MLTRLSIDNYRTFQRFEWRPGRVAILMGRNGTGKTALLDVLVALRELVCGDGTLATCFPTSSLTRWLAWGSQRIELDVELPVGALGYSLALEHPEKGETRVVRETLRAGETTLFDFESGVLRLHDDAGRPLARFAASVKKSGLPLLVPDASNTRATAFTSWLSRLAVVQPEPAAMHGRAPTEDARLRPNLANFANWYRHTALGQPSDLAAARRAFADIVPRFREMIMRLDDQHVGWLHALFDGPQGAPYTLRFDELSHGQRVLFALYAILHTGTGPRLLALDEPDNFVALEEIQPFLLEALDRTLAGDGAQLFVASHHPEYLDQLAPDHGWVFDRPTGDATVLGRFRADVALSASSLVARGELSANPTDEPAP